MKTDDKIHDATPDAIRLEVAWVLGWRLWEEKRGQNIVQTVTRPRDREPWMQARDWEAQRERYRALTWNDYKRGSFIGEFPHWTERIADAWALFHVCGDEVWKIDHERTHVFVHIGPVSAVATIEETGGDKDKAACLAICRAFLRYREKQGAGDE
jgi:hypothetical protein